jgi:hypothetical protein
VIYDIDNYDNYQEVVDLCGSWWQDSLFYKTYRIPYNVDKKLFDCANESGALISVVGREDGKVIAAYVGIKQPYIFNPEYTIAVECVWCLHAEHRTLRNALGLLDQVEKAMDKHDIDIVSLAVSAEPKYKSLAKLLERRRFVLMDDIYMKYL